MTSFWRDKDAVITSYIRWVASKIYIINAAETLPAYESIINP